MPSHRPILRGSAWRSSRSCSYDQQNRSGLLSCREIAWSGRPALHWQSQCGCPAIILALSASPWPSSYPPSPICWVDTPTVRSATIPTGIFDSYRQMTTYWVELWYIPRDRFWRNWNFPAGIWGRSPRRFFRFHWNTLLLFHTIFCQTDVQHRALRHRRQISSWLCIHCRPLRIFSPLSAISRRGCSPVRYRVWWLLCWRRSKRWRKPYRRPYLRPNFPWTPHTLWSF